MKKALFLILLCLCLLAVSCGESAEGAKDTDTAGVETASPDVTEKATSETTEVPGSEAATEAPETEPPATEPPATDPPATEPPATEPPATEPPATEPPATEPPATEPPAAVVPPSPDYNTTVAGVSVYSPGQIEVTDPVYVTMSSDPYIRRVILTTDTPISNFEIAALNSDGNDLGVTVFQTIPEFTPGKQILVDYYQPEYFPGAGVRFTDAGGTAHLLEFAVSGRDGTVFFIEH